MCGLDAGAGLFTALRIPATASCHSEGSKGTDSGIDTQAPAHTRPPGARRNVHGHGSSPLWKHHSNVQSSQCQLDWRLVPRNCAGWVSHGDGPPWTDRIGRRSAGLGQCLLGKVSAEALDGDAQLRRSRHRVGSREHLQQAQHAVRLDLFDGFRSFDLGHGPLLINTPGRSGHAARLR